MFSGFNNQVMDREALAGGGAGGGFARGTPAPQQSPNNMMANLAAYFGAVNRPNNFNPMGGGQFGLPYDPSQPPPFMPPQFGGGFPPPMVPQMGGQLPPQPMGGQMPQGFPPSPMLGGGLPPQVQPPMMGGHGPRLPFRRPMEQQETGGYDGSGINPGGNFYPQMGGMRRARNLGLGRR